MKTFSLNGVWQLHRADAPGEVLTAPVPGCVHDALLDHNKIPHPFYRFNERDSQWVGWKNWSYEREFDAPAELLREEHVVLACDGLDTFATVFVNGREIARTDNMFRSYEWDVRSVLTPGKNKIRIEFESVLPFMKKMSDERLLPAWNEPSAGSWWGYNGRGYVRKQACQFGWDWGQMCVSSGIWRDIALRAWSRARIDDWTVLQDHSMPGKVGLTVSVKAACARADGLRAEVALKFQNEIVARGESPLTADGRGEIVLNIDNPRLWWPNGLGDQPLYEIEITLSGSPGDLLDRVTKRIGLRTLVLIREPDAHGTSFHFAANGVRFFAKGSNWIPLDQYPSSRNLDRYDSLLAGAADARMNMMRVWGGGYYSHDEFYDRCDELGICVWQDMMFGCGTYPTWDKAFMENVYAETVDNVKRLRHRACLALWCGNNELEMGFCADEWSDKKMSWDSYLELFEKLIPAALNAADPHTAYIPGSPHSSGEERRINDSPKSGDLHLWEIWFGHSPFENYRNYPHRFVSEFGFQSFPDPRTVAAFTEPGDRRVNSPVMEYHERSQPKVNMILHQLMDWFQLPESFDDTLWLSQITHGIGLKTGIEHWRRNWPQTGGATYWQINDCWPAPTWASIDVFGRWKALHYFAKRFFEPVLITGLENKADGTVAVHVNNDHNRIVTGTIRMLVTDLDGATLREESWEHAAPAVSSTHSRTIDLAGLPAAHGGENLLVWLDFLADEKCLSQNLVLFARPKTFALNDPLPVIEATEKQGAFHLKITVEKPALWAWLTLEDIDCRFSDNFNSIRPGHAWKIEAVPALPVGLDEFRRRLRFHSIFDTMAPRES